MSSDHRWTMIGLPLGHPGRGPRSSAYVPLTLSSSARGASLTEVPARSSQLHVFSFIGAAASPLMFAPDLSMRGLPSARKLAVANKPDFS